MSGVREPEPADFDAMVALTAALRDYERALAAGRIANDDDATHYRGVENWAWRSGGGVLAAFDGDEAVGFVALGFVAFGFDHGARGGRSARGLVAELFVRPEARGQGWSRRLLAEAEARLAEAGAQEVEITALADNASALEAYRALGFQPVEITFAKRLTPRPD